MGSVPFKFQQNKTMKEFNNKQRQMIYEKWKYEIKNSDLIQCSITFNDMKDRSISIDSNINQKL